MPCYLHKSDSLLRDKYKAKQLNLNHKITLAKLLLVENVTLLSLAVLPLSNISFMVLILQPCFSFKTCRVGEKVSALHLYLKPSSTILSVMYVCTSASVSIYLSIIF